MLGNVRISARELSAVLKRENRDRIVSDYGKRQFWFDVMTLLFDIVYAVCAMVLMIPIYVLYAVGYIGVGLVYVLDKIRFLLNVPTWWFWRKRSKFIDECKDKR